MNAKMTTSALMSVFVLTGGCLKNECSEAEIALEDARQMIWVVSTNQTIGAIWGTRRVREDLKKIESLKDRRELIEEWSSALSHMPVEGLSPSNRYGVLREASRMLVWDVADALLEIAAPMMKYGMSIFRPLNGLTFNVPACEHWHWKQAATTEHGETDGLITKHLRSIAKSLSRTLNSTD